MSYPGSHQKFGLSDLQLLQQQLMLARLQELQRQQQLGQFGDGKPSNPVNNLSMLAKHAVGGQFPNLGGTLYNASGIGASSNINWMHQNVSSSTQGVTRDSSYSHGEGLMMSPLQQPDMSLYGTTVTSGRGNLGQCTPMQGVSYSSNEKPMPQMPQLTNSLFGDKHYVSRSHAHSIDGSFMLRQDLQGQGSMGNASGHMLSNGMSSQNFSQVKSLQKVTSPPGYNKIGEPPVDTVFLELTKQTNDSRGTTTLDPLEEKILFDTEDSSWDISFSKLAALDNTEFVEASSGKENINSFPCVQSGSWSALMQSAVAEASSSDTGIQEELSGLSFQNIESSVGRQPSNVVFNEKQSSSDNLRAPVSSVDSMKSQLSSLWPDCQQFPRVPDPAGLLTNSCVAVNDRDICLGSKTSALSMSGMIKNDYEFNQQAVDSHSFMPMNQDTVQKDYNHQSNNNPMAIDTLYKKAAEIYGNRNHCQGENSCDSYNSKVSQAGHGCLNAEDSESSARSRQKSQNQAICISSPGANSQQECFGHLKSTTFPTNTNPMVKGKPKLFADTFSKGSPASDVSASFDSQYTSESQPRGLGNTLQAFNVSQTESQVLNVSNISVSQSAAIPDKFSFQSSVPGDSRLVSLGHGQKGQTWWTPSSFGQSYTPLQGASLPETCAGNSNVYGKTASEASNLKGNSLEVYISDFQHVNNQVEGKNISTFESVRKTFPETSQYISLPGFSPTQDAYQLKKANSSDCESIRSDVLSMPLSENVKDLPSSFGLPSRSLTMGKDISDEQNAPMIENVAVVEDCKSAEIYCKISTDAMAYAGNSINNELAQRSFSGTTLRGLPICSQPLVLHNVENSKKQLGIVYTDFNKVGSNSTALSDLNKQWVPDIPRQQPVPDIHSLVKNPFDNQIGSCCSGDNNNIVEASTQFSALQYMHSHKVPMLQNYSNGSNVLYDRMRQLQMRSQIGPVGYVQNEYIKNRPMFSLHDSSALSSIQPYENDQLSRIATHVNGADASKKNELLSGLANQIVASKQSLPPSVPLPDGNVHLVISRSKKRKSVFDCLPWYKKVMATQEFPDISAAEADWAEVTNRLKEHVDEGERNEMGPIFRAKRRLIATTELTQLVFQPPSTSVLSVDAGIEYDIVVYTITKLALADACGLTNVARPDCSMPRDNRNGGMANSLSDNATELLKRTKELETHIERSIKGISVLDILIECQELEKFGIINHFAKYHNRGPESVGNLSASSSTGVTSFRPFLQRYVNAVPVPAKLPEGVHCISL